MLTFMPSSRGKDSYLRILSEDLITVSVSAILASLEKRDVTIHLPKFNIEKDLNLVPTLQHVCIIMQKIDFKLQRAYICNNRYCS